MKPPTAEYSDFVEHPRYGKGPRFTGLDVADSPDGTVYCHWHSPIGVRVQNTAVVANVARQGSATLRVTHYFDAKRVCRKCGRPFLFFAEEQKYWYEELKFPLEADCLDCAPCRKDEQQLRAIRQKYDALLAETARTETDTLELVGCALLLVESSVFSAKVLPKLRGILKPLLLNREGPSYIQAQALVSRINGDAAR
jgi:Probable zinc-ribbon domain